MKSLIKIEYMKYTTHFSLPLIKGVLSYGSINITKDNPKYLEMKAFACVRINYILKRKFRHNIP